MRRLGIDIGSSSLGWLLYEHGHIIKKGVITFETGMRKKQLGYVSPTSERRDARAKRILIRARKRRKWELLGILLPDFCPLIKGEFELWSKYKKGQKRKFPESENFLKWLACDFSYLEGEVRKYNNPYDLRVRALDYKLEKHEFGRALYHLIQRRGYKDIGEADKETKNQIERRKGSGFEDALSEYRTISEALVNKFLNKNERARNHYPYRNEYEYELEKICKAQGYDILKDSKGNYREKFVQNLWNAIIWQQPLKSQKGNIGKCTLEPQKLRCPVSHPVFEIFRAWQFINTIKFYDESGEKQSLTSELRMQLFNELFLKRDSSFKFEDIRKFLDKKFGKARRYNYPIDKDGKYDTSVSGMPVCKGLINIIGDKMRDALSEIENFNNSQAPKIVAQRYSVYDLWHILFEFDKKSSKNRNFLEEFGKQKLGIDNMLRIKKGKETSISLLEELREKFVQGYSYLSVKAICKIIPFLKEGYLYNEAVLLAKMPELFGENWLVKKEKIYDAMKNANRIYEWRKIVNEISNNLIDRYKGLPDDERFAYKDFQYILTESDMQDVVKSCESKFGGKTWNLQQNKDEIICAVKEQYQAFFKDEKREYCKLQSLAEIFDLELKEQKIVIDLKNLYHHSNIENRYLAKSKIWNGSPQLPKVKNEFQNDVEILPASVIDGIKNPMFNKSMSILRKLINELIKNGEIDKETEVIVELARELNDNNRRIAIERYQKHREKTREKYREFLKKFKEKENHNSSFELWTKQILEQTIDEEGNKIVNKKDQDIFIKKEALKRYELWMEQKGQCIYTGRRISIPQLFSIDIDIEHTIPRSVLPDNTLANQTVCYALYNRGKKRKQLPTQCANFYCDKEGWGTKIEPRLDNWRQIRDYYKKLYESKLKPKGFEDEAVKNKRIQDKHYYKLHYDYWKDKLERFEAEEVKDSWARRQLVDTQMISKYAREFLKTYFMKVLVQKGKTTAAFRKIYGFQEEDEIKQRDKHTHHIIDALVLTLIPTNSSYREKILKEYYKAKESYDREVVRVIKEKVFPQKINVQKFIREIESSTLVYNYEKDKILLQSPKIVRKRGRVQYVKDKAGKFVLDENGEKIIKKSNGDTVRSSLYAQTYLGKIKDVEQDGFCFVKRENIDNVKKSEALMKDIVDPVIRKLVKEQKDQGFVKDYQGNVIRHVRIKTKAGKEVKERINYRSKHEYKNKFYSQAGSIPYAVLLQKIENGKVSRKMMPIASFEIAKIYQKNRRFDVCEYIQEFYPAFSSWNKQLLKVGQKVFFLKNDNEFESRESIDFQRNRLYVISQFKNDGSKIILQYHLEARSAAKIDEQVKKIKSTILEEKERELNISLIVEDKSILDIIQQREDYKKRLYDFEQRLKIIEEYSDKPTALRLGEKIENYKTESSSISIEGVTPILGLSKANWNFLLEGVDFDMKLDGTIKFRS